MCRGRFVYITLIIGLAFSIHCRDSGGRKHGSTAPPVEYRIKSVTLLAENGGRADWSPESIGRIVYDRMLADQYFDVFTMKADGTDIRPVTDGNPGIAQRHNGNPRWHPSGKYIVFQSEKEEHYGVENKWPANPGIGVFCEMFAATPDGSEFHQLTDHPTKMAVDDGIPAYGVLHPHFSPDGSKFLWTEVEHPATPGTGGDWGDWKIMIADFVDSTDGPRLENAEVLFEPGENMSTFCEAFGFTPDGEKIVIVGSLTGADHHEFGMDIYVFELESRTLTNLTRTPEWWEEGNSVTPDGEKIIYMTNVGSPMDFSDPHWYYQKRTREYWMMNLDGTDNRQVSHFNEPGYAEYTGWPTIVCECSFHPDGRRLLAIRGVDYGSPDKADFHIDLVLVEFE